MGCRVSRRRKSNANKDERRSGGNDRNVNRRLDPTEGHAYLDLVRKTWRQLTRGESDETDPRRIRHRNQNKRGLRRGQARAGQGSANARRGNATVHRDNAADRPAKLEKLAPKLRKNFEKEMGKDDWKSKDKTKSIHDLFGEKDAAATLAAVDDLVNASGDEARLNLAFNALSERVCEAKKAEPGGLFAYKSVEDVLAGMRIAFIMMLDDNARGGKMDFASFNSWAKFMDDSCAGILEAYWKMQSESGILSSIGQAGIGFIRDNFWNILSALCQMGLYYWRARRELEVTRATGASGASGASGRDREVCTQYCMQRPGAGRGGPQNQPAPYVQQQRWPNNGRERIRIRIEANPDAFLGP